MALIAQKGVTVADLILPVKRIYCEQMRDGTKKAEYRLMTDFWARRLHGRQYDRVIITLGYPKRDDAAKRLVFPWCGYTVETITHPHFGSDPVKVFAIKVEPAQNATARIEGVLVDKQEVQP
jgi:hypothetical protein